VAAGGAAARRLAAAGFLCRGGADCTAMMPGPEWTTVRNAADRAMLPIGEKEIGQGQGDL
jgi:hypothetical protein